MRLRLEASRVDAGEGGTETYRGVVVTVARVEYQVMEGGAETR